jgi:hypothetical protein
LIHRAPFPVIGAFPIGGQPTRVKKLPRDPLSEITSRTGKRFVTDRSACRNPDGFPTSRDGFTPGAREIQSTPAGFAAKVIS